jgi:hypothetical protein
MIAARTRIRGFYGHYMGLILGLFLQMGVFKRFYFGAMETGGYWGFVLLKNGGLGVIFHDGDVNPGMEAEVFFGRNGTQGTEALSLLRIGVSKKRKL